MKKYKGGKNWLGGEKTDYQFVCFFSRGKNGPARFFPGEKTDWGGKILACYTASWNSSLIRGYTGHLSIYLLDALLYCKAILLKF